MTQGRSGPRSHEEAARAGNSARAEECRIFSARAARLRRSIVVPMGESARDRQVTALIARCYAGLDAAALREEVLRRLRRIMPVDAAFFATVDPITVLFTSAVADDPLAEARPLFMDNEFGRDDVNKFAALAEAADPVSSLERATRGDWQASPRYREIMYPLGLGDELRAALIAKKRCWGVMCLHREDASHGFDAWEVDLVRRISPHVAEGLRRAVSVAPAAAARAESAAPGIIVLDADLTVVSMSPEAQQWLAEIDDADWPGPTELPIAIYATAAGLVQLQQGGAAPPATVRLRSRSGRWLSLHASTLHGSGTSQIGVVIEPTPASQISSVLLSAHGLTDAQARVTALVLRGHSTQQIVRELHISANTVQEHLTATFDKFGVRSRRELVAAVLSGHR
jgi:DNA-binding CsgD family transcriptional regulator